jgi:hypothetical protein
MGPWNSLNMRSLRSNSLKLPADALIFGSLIVVCRSRRRGCHWHKVKVRMVMLSTTKKCLRSSSEKASSLHASLSSLSLPHSMMHLSARDDFSSGVPAGGIAAFVVIPTIFFLSVGLGLYFTYRRRKRLEQMLRENPNDPVVRYLYLRNTLATRESGRAQAELMAMGMMMQVNANALNAELRASGNPDMSIGIQRGNPSGLGGPVIMDGSSVPQQAPPVYMKVERSITRS